MINGLRQSAEYLVVDELGHRGVVAAQGARRVSLEFYLTEIHAQRVDEQQTGAQALADAQDQLQRLGGLDASYQTS